MSKVPKIFFFLNTILKVIVSERLLYQFLNLFKMPVFTESLLKHLQGRFNFKHLSARSPYSNELKVNKQYFSKRYGCYKNYTYLTTLLCSSRRRILWCLLKLITIYEWILFKNKFWHKNLNIYRFFWYTFINYNLNYNIIL